ncbi:MAG: GGDEF domain-containing protein [Gammaproteobacteria bacterium]
MMAKNNNKRRLEVIRLCRDSMANPAFRITLVYLAISLLWISISGRVAVFLSGHTDIPLDKIELIKGTVFVLVTALLLFVLIARSVGKLKTHEHRIQRLNRVYAVLSGINSAILRIRDRQQLLDEACRIASVHGLYEAVSIRMINPETGEVETLASAGLAKDFIDNIKVTVAEGGAYSHGPTGTALRENRLVVINNMAADASVEPWREVTKQYYIRSSAAFPITIDGETIGVFSFYSRERDAFDSDEVRLLDEVVADTSLGLEYISKDQQLAFVSTHDVVTGLPNRALLEDRIEQYLARHHHQPGRIAALIVIVVENYTRTVDIYGPSVGDKITREIAGRLTGILREGDTAAKIGSHRFAIFMVDMGTRGDVTYASRKITSGLPDVIPINGKDVVPQYRAGISICPKDATDADSLIRYANLALTSARKEDVPYRFYTSEEEAETRRADNIERLLGTALQRQEFRLYYQPIIDTRNGRMTGLEALIRWQNSELGMVSPGDFIPIAEDTGLIEQLGHWIVEQAVHQLSDWTRDGGNKDVHITINISSSQLRDKAFARKLLSAIERIDSHLPRHSLALEITESMLMNRSESIMRQFARIREAGLSIYVDDFGTGYSSLSYLHQFPVDVLKIDRKFINDMTGNKSAEVLVRGIVSMACGLGLRTVAEGVETEEQFAMLKDLGCDMAQGFLFSRPVPAGEIDFGKWKT